MDGFVSPGQEASATEGNKQSSFIVLGNDAGAWKRVCMLVAKQRTLYPGTDWVIGPTHDGLRAVQTR